MADYECILKGNLARELGSHYEWREKYWGRRYHSASLADDEVDQQKGLRYVLANGCKDGLVDSPLDWPGVSTAWALSKGIWTLKGTWLDRSSERSEKGPIEVEETVKLSPLPFMEDWSRDRQRGWFCGVLRDIEDEARERRRREGKRSVGVKRILTQNPYEMPANFQPSPAPLFHASSPKERQKLRLARELKEASYQFAAERLRRGLPNVVFPENCFLTPARPSPTGPAVEARASSSTPLSLRRSTSASRSRRLPIVQSTCAPTLFA